MKTDHVDCYKALYFGDRGEEIKVLQLIVNGWYAYNGDTKRISVNGRFNQKTKVAMEELELYNGDGEPHYIFSYNTRLMIGEDAPCAFY